VETIDGHGSVPLVWPSDSLPVLYRSSFPMPVGLPDRHLAVDGPRLLWDWLPVVGGEGSVMSFIGGVNLYHYLHRFGTVVTAKGSHLQHGYHLTCPCRSI